MAQSSLNQRFGSSREEYGRLKGSPLMGIKKMALVAALGLTMASAPVMAQTASVERTAAALEEINGQVETTTTTYVIAFFVILAIGLGIYAATDTENDDKTSP